KLGLAKVYAEEFRKPHACPARWLFEVRDEGHPLSLQTSLTTWGLALLPWLECHGVIIAHSNLKLQGSGAETTGMYHHTQLIFLIFCRDRVLLCCSGWSQIPGLK
uniref:Uncharacterized protein n=1 Tax=Prolemur simus TaxID=1328070 RepID=A0A8C9A2P5_PROSS